MSGVGVRASRMPWGERLARAVGTWRHWTYLPLELRLDKAFKTAGFRDVILENQELRKALKRIADWPDDNMATATTLHYDMRGWAREALGDDFAPGTGASDSSPGGGGVS